MTMSVEEEANVSEILCIPLRFKVHCHCGGASGPEIYNECITNNFLIYKYVIYEYSTNVSGYFLIKLE